MWDTMKQQHCHKKLEGKPTGCEEGVRSQLRLQSEGSGDVRQLKYPTTGGRKEERCVKSRLQLQNEGKDDVRQHNS